MLPAVLPTLMGVGMDFLKRRGDDALEGAYNKVMGVPTPADPMQTGLGDSGVEYREFMDNAFPGTTPWERLGANTPAGALGSADVAAKNQLKLQYKDLEVRERLADKSNIASIISSMGPQGAFALDNAIAKYANSAAPSGQYPSQNERDQQALQKKLDHLDAQIRSLGASAGLDEERAKLEKERAKYAAILAKLDVAKAGAGVIGSAVGGFMGGSSIGLASGIVGRATKLGGRIIGNLRNNSRLPARFNTAGGSTSRYRYKRPRHI